MNFIGIPFSEIIKLSDWQVWLYIKSRKLAVNGANVLLQGDINLMQYVTEAAMHVRAMKLNMPIPRENEAFVKFVFVNCARLEICKQRIIDDMSRDPQRQALYCKMFSGVREIVLGNEIKDIPRGTFAGYANLEKLRGGDGVEYVGEDAFAGCPKLGKLNLKNIRLIDEKAFGEHRQRILLNMRNDSVLYDLEHCGNFRNDISIRFFGISKEELQESIFEQRGELQFEPKVFESVDCARIVVLKNGRSGLEDGRVYLSGKGDTVIKPKQRIDALDLYDPHALQVHGCRNSGVGVEDEIRICSGKRKGCGMEP